MDTFSIDRIKVSVLHSEPLIEAGIVHTLAGEADLDVVAGTSEWSSANVVVTDLTTGLRLAKEIRMHSTGVTRTRLLVLTGRNREFEVRKALEAGVHGYVLVSCDTLELVRGVRAVGSGARYLSVAVASRVADSMSRDLLTAREADVLHLLSRGHCNKLIAKHLAICVGTVKVHVKAIMAKLQASSRTHAVSVAMARGLVHDEVSVLH